MRTAVSLLCCLYGLLVIHPADALELSDLLGAWRHDKSQSVIEFRQTDNQGLEAFLIALPENLKNLGFRTNDKLLSNIRIHGDQLAFQVTIRSENTTHQDICPVVQIPGHGHLQADGETFQGSIRPGEYVLLRNHDNDVIRCLHVPGDRDEPFVLTRVTAPIDILMADGSPYRSENRRFQLNDVQPFRIQITYASPPPTPVGEVTVQWPGGQTELPLHATDKPHVVVSDWHYISTHSLRDYRASDGLIESNTDWAYTLTKDLFAGTWQVSQTGGELGEAFGVAKVADDGKCIDLFLHGNGKQKHYRSFEIQATKDTQGHRHTLSARFQEISRQPPADLIRGRDHWPQGYSIVLPDATQRLRFEAGNKTAEADIRFHVAPPDRIRFLLMGRSSGRFAGTWSEERADGDLGSGGQHTWSKDAKIERIVVLEDQTARHTPGAVMDNSYAYPFADEGDPYRQTHRTLFIYGRNLPDSYGDAMILHAEDDTIEYELEGLPGEDRRLFEQGWQKAGIENPEAYDAILVKAKLKRGVTSGFKLLTLNGVPGMWHLFFADAVGKLSFAHQWRQGEFQATRSLYSSDIAYLVIDDLSTIPNRGIEFKIKRNGDDVGRVTARRVGSPSQAEYQSQPMRFYKRQDSHYAPPENAQALSIGVKKSDRIEAEPVDPSILALVPEKATAIIYDQPAELGMVWRDALRRMAACHGDQGQDFSRLTHEEAETYSKFILTELSSRRVRISKGDQAAAILIRDELVTMMREIIPAYRSIADGNDQKVLAFIASGRQKPEPFWQAINGKDGRGHEVKLEALLTYDRAASSWGMTAAQARTHVIREVRQGLREFVALMQGSVNRAVQAGDCNLTELMVIAGQRTAPVIARLLPRLVYLEEQHGTTYWAPDLVAQGYVSGLHITGAAIRALDEYARIDDAYKSMALALASGGAAFAISGLGYATAGAYLMIAADVTDMVYFGGKGVYEYVTGDRLVDYAKGLTPAMGEDFLAEAELASSKWYWAAIGVLAPGLGAGAGLRQLKQLKNADAIARGARLADQIEVFDEAALARLSDAQRTDLAALYTGLSSKRTKAAATLTEVEKAHLQKFDEFFGQVRPTPPATTAPPTGAFWPMPESVASGRPRLTEPAGASTSTLDEGLSGGAAAASKPRVVGTPVETPGGMRPVFKQENCNTCGVAAARTAVARLTGNEIEEQEMIRRALMSGRGYRTSIDFDAGRLVNGGTTMRQMMDMLEDAGVTSQSLVSRAREGFDQTRFLQEAASELDQGNQVLTMVHYAREGGKGISPHWVTIEKVANGRVTRGGRTVIEGPYVIIGDPATGKSVAMAQDDFVRHWKPAETIVGWRAEHAAEAASAGRNLTDIVPDGIRGGGRVAPGDLPGHLHGLRGLVRNNRISQADLADLIDDIDKMLYARWHKGAERVSKILQQRLNAQMGHLPASLRRELSTHLRVRMLNHENFFGTPLRDIVPPELGFGTTTQGMRNAVQNGKLADQFRTRFGSHAYGQLAGRLEPDHIEPVSNIIRLDGFKNLEFQNRMKVIYNMENIQALPASLNKSKSNLSALEWQAEMARRGEPALPADYVRWLADEQRRLKQVLQEQIYTLLREQAGARPQ